MHQLGRCLENIQWKPFLDLAVSVINFDRSSLVYGMWINFCSIIFAVKEFLHIYWIYFKIRFTKNAWKILTLSLCLCDSDTGCLILKRAFWKYYNPSKTNYFCEDISSFSRKQYIFDIYSYFSKKIRGVSLELLIFGGKFYFYPYFFKNVYPKKDLRKKNWKK